MFRIRKTVPAGDCSILTHDYEGKLIENMGNDTPPPPPQWPGLHTSRGGRGGARGGERLAASLLACSRLCSVWAYSELLARRLRRLNARYYRMCVMSHYPLALHSLFCGHRLGCYTDSSSRLRFFFSERAALGSVIATLVSLCVLTRERFTLVDLRER